MKLVFLLAETEGWMVACPRSPNKQAAEVGYELPGHQQTYLLKCRVPDPPSQNIWFRDSGCELGRGDNCGDSDTTALDTFTE